MPQNDKEHVLPLRAWVLTKNPHLEHNLRKALKHACPPSEESFSKEPPIISTIGQILTSCSPNSDRSAEPYSDPNQYNLDSLPRITTIFTDPSEFRRLENILLDKKLDPLELYSYFIFVLSQHIPTSKDAAIDSRLQNAWVVDPELAEKLYQKPSRETYDQLPNLGPLIYEMVTHKLLEIRHQILGKLNEEMNQIATNFIENPQGYPIEELESHIFRAFKNAEISQLCGLYEGTQFVIRRWSSFSGQHPIVHKIPMPLRDKKERTTSIIPVTRTNETLRFLEMNFLRATAEYLRFVITDHLDTIKTLSPDQDRSLCFSFRLIQEEKTTEPEPLQV